MAGLSAAVAGAVGCGAAASTHRARRYAARSPTVGVCGPTVPFASSSRLSAWSMSAAASASMSGGGGGALELAAASRPRRGAASGAGAVSTPMSRGAVSKPEAAADREFAQIAGQVA